MTVGTVAGGIIGNRADAAFNKYVGGSLSHLAKSLSIPVNHDLHKGLLSAHQRALAFTAETMSRQSRGIADRIVANRIVAIAKEPVVADSGSFAQVELLTPLIAAHPTAGQASLLDEAACMLVTWLEQKSGETLPPHFRAVLTQPAPDGRAPWVAVLRVLIAEEIKTKPRFVNIFLAENVAEIAGRTVIVEAIVTEMERGLTGLRDELGLVAADVRQVLANQVEQERHNEQVLEFMAMAKASGIFQQAAAQGISERAVRRIVEQLGGQGIERDDLLTWLEGWIDAAKAALGRRSNEGEAFETARAEAARLFQDGSGTYASDPLMALLAQEQKESQRRQLVIVEEAIRFSVLSLDIEGLREKQLMAACIAHPADPDGRAEYLFTRGIEYYESGANEGGNFAALASIECYHLALKERPRERVPLGWAAIQTNLASALQLLGEREHGTKRILSAISAFHLALEEYSQDKTPKPWALVQSNLGNALSVLAERHGEIWRLEEAIDAYYASLLERTRERDPFDWALTHSHLGGALLLRSKATSDLEGVFEAIKIIKLALSVFTQTDSPLEYALSKTSIGNGYRTIGELTDDARYFEMAIDAFTDSLEVYTEARPLEWAIAQRNLGTGLYELGRRGTGTARLEEAVSRFRLALRELTPDRDPLRFADAQMNLGRALFVIGQRGEGTERLKEAEAAFESALSIVSSKDQPHFRTMYETCLRLTRQLIAKRSA